MSSVVFRHIDDLPIAWRDSHGDIHACEGTELHPGLTLYWTLCEIDVPKGAAELIESADGITCSICRERMLEPAPSFVLETSEAAAPTPGPKDFVPLLLRKPMV